MTQKDESPNASEGPYWSEELLAVLCERTLLPDSLLSCSRSCGNAGDLSLRRRTGGPTWCVHRDHRRLPLHAGLHPSFQDLSLIHISEPTRPY